MTLDMHLIDKCYYLSQTSQNFVVSNAQNPKNMRSVGKLFHYLYQPAHLKKTRTCLLAHSRLKHHKPAKQLEEVQSKSECLEPCKAPGKKSIWGIFGSNKKEPKEKKPARECERVEIVSDEQAEIDMKKISEMGDGEVYRTCGTAYLLQHDYYQQPKPYKPSNEEIILEEMIKDPSLKGQCDPMPAFETVSLRMMSLNERKLHPLYKKLMSIPKRPKPKISPKPKTDTKPASLYQTRSGPVKPEDFPAHLKINQEMLQKKNIMCEFKRAEPPQQMLGRMVEIKQNERPKLMQTSKNIVDVLKSNK